MTRAAIVPTYDEPEMAPEVVQQLREELFTDVIVVDDSPTLETCRSVRDSHGQVPTIIHRESETGLSSAIIRGFAAADADALVVIDGDGQHCSETASLAGKMVETSYDLVVGTRHANSGEVADDWPTHRRLISAGADRLARAAVPKARELSDPMSGLFAVDAQLINAAMAQFRPTGYKILLEILARCPISTVTELGYEFSTSESESNLGPAEYLRFAQHLARLSLPSRQPSRTRETVVRGRD